MARRTHRRARVIRLPVKAFLSIKYHADHGNREHIERVCRALKRCGYDTVCVARDLEAWGAVALAADDLMRRTFTALESCDVAVVELSEKGVGVGIEAGYAHARGIPIIAMARTGCDISATLQGIARQVIWYNDADVLLRQLQIRDQEVHIQPRRNAKITRIGIELATNCEKIVTRCRRLHQDFLCDLCVLLRLICHMRQ